jgi:hypothetical protein
MQELVWDFLFLILVIRLLNKVNQYYIMHGNIVFPVFKLFNGVVNSFNTVVSFAKVILNSFNAVFT